MECFGHPPHGGRKHFLLKINKRRATRRRFIKFHSIGKLYYSSNVVEKTSDYLFIFEIIFMKKKSNIYNILH